MKMNPVAAMKLKGMLDKFKENHPKVPMFFAAASNSISEGSIIELRVTSPEGKTMVTNMRVLSDDMDMIEEFKKMS
jgi:hypothetical protein